MLGARALARLVKVIARRPVARANKAIARMASGTCAASAGTLATVPTTAAGEGPTPRAAMDLGPGRYVSAAARASS